MARKLNALALVLVAAATLLHGSAAQTRHVVGDALGWTIPPNGPSTYSNWASNKPFKVGDTLVFNFTNGQHNVATVTKAAFDACNTSNPISTVSTSPATITLNETGSHYYVCTFGNHCSLGQKLSVTVSGASSPSPSPSPAPRPSTPPRASPVPAPQPSTPPRASPVPAPQPSTPPPASPVPASAPEAPTPPSPSPPPSSPNSPPTPTTPSSPSPSGASSPPPNSGASSLGIAGFSATLLSIAAALLY